MANNDFLKNYSNEHNNNFGSFAPKNAGGTSSNAGGAGKSKPAGVNNGSNSAVQRAAGQTPQGKAVNAASGAKQKIDSMNPVKNVGQGAKADIKSSITGQDRDQILQEQRDKDSDLKNMGAKTAGKQAARKGAKSLASKAGGGKGLGSLGKNVVAKGVMGKAHSGLGSLAHMAKGLGAKLFGGMKGMAASMTAGVAKAGAAVGGALNVSATVGTALVLSGTVVTATIPVAGGIGYVSSHYSQRTDGCIPAEYEEKESDDVNTKAQGMAVAQIARDWCTPNGANHYVWGGWSVGPKDDYDPNNAHSGGCDCGHFVQLCFWKAGSTILTPSNPIGTCDTICDVAGGKYVVKRGTIQESDCQPGDILNNNHHAWLYIGNGEIAEASNERNGLRIAPWRGDATCLTRPYEASKDGDSSGGSITPSADMQANMDLVAAYGKKVWKQYHIWPSVLVAQSICETSCGTNGYTVARNNWFCLKAFDSNLDAASYFPTPEAGIEGAIRNYWGGASPVYKDVIQSHSPQEQMKNICRSGWASSHYGDPSGSTGGSLKKAWDQYGLSKYDAGIVDYEPDMSAYGGSLDGDSLIDASGANENADIAEKTADDGCGGEMEGKDNGDAAAFTGQGIVHNNGWTYLNFDMDKVFKLGHQLPRSSDCYVYAVGYADLVMRGKWDFNGEATQLLMRSHYGGKAGHANYGNPEKIGGSENLSPNKSEAMEKIKTAIMKDHKPVTVCTDAWSGCHFMTVVGWRDSAGNNPSWDDLVVIDSAPPGGLAENEYYQNTQFHLMKANFNGHSLNSGKSGATYDGWTK